MIEIKNISKTYNGTDNVIDRLSLSIRSGSVFGFLGPNGAGKTTAIKIAVGLNSPDEGEVLIGNGSPFRSETRENIGFMPEEPHFYEQLTGLEFMKFTNDLFDRNRRSSSEEIDEILEKTGVYKARNKKIRDYSKGMKQRLGFAQALVNNPNYIFLDEPLEGLDPIGRIEIKKILANLKNKGKTIFFNSHILADVENICDQIGIIHRGRLIYSGPVAEFKKNKSLEEQFVETIRGFSRQ